MKVGDPRWHLGWAENLSSMTPETLRHWSYTWVILIDSRQNNNRHHIRCRKKFKDWPLN
jgi:hypothetical protein